jgi:hypothetical protein
VGNKVDVGIAAFGFCLLVLNTVVWIGVFNVIIERPSETDAFATITPMAQKTAREVNPADDEESAIKASTITAERAIFGMSVTKYAEIQVRFLEEMDPPPQDKIGHWEEVAEGRR